MPDTRCGCSDARPRDAAAPDAGDERAGDAIAAARCRHRAAQARQGDAWRPGRRGGPSQDRRPRRRRDDGGAGEGRRRRRPHGPRQDGRGPDAAGAEAGAPTTSPGRPPAIRRRPTLLSAQGAAACRLPRRGTGEGGFRPRRPPRLRAPQAGGGRSPPPDPAGGRPSPAPDRGPRRPSDASRTGARGAALRPARRTRAPHHASRSPSRIAYRASRIALASPRRARRRSVAAAAVAASAAEQALDHAAQALDHAADADAELLGQANGKARGEQLVERELRVVETAFERERAVRCGRRGSSPPAPPGAARRRRCRARRRRWPSSRPGQRQAAGGVQALALAPWRRASGRACRGARRLRWRAAGRAAARPGPGP